MLYNSQMFKGVSPVSVNVKNERWEVTLKLILNPKGFDYAMKDGIVVIRRMHTEKRVNRIRGTVFDANKEPIPGASIIVKGTRTGTSTNIEGEVLPFAAIKALHGGERPDPAKCPAGTGQNEDNPIPRQPCAQTAKPPDQETTGYLWPTGDSRTRLYGIILGRV